MLNNCEFIGNVTKDIELKQTPNGTEVVNFDIAVNKKFTDSAGVKQEKTEFISIVAFNKKATLINEYVKRGDKIFVSGEFQTRSWEHTDGTKRYKTDIMMDKVIFLGGKGESTEAPAPKRTEKATPPPRKVEEEISVEDIPF